MKQEFGSYSQCCDKNSRKCYDRFNVSIFIRCAALAFALAAPFLGQNDMRTWMTRGIDAFRHGRMAESLDDFEQALKVDPNSVDAHISIAFVEMQKYIPGLESEENDEANERIKQNLLTALEIDPRNKIALGYLAEHYYDEPTGKSLAQKIEILRHAEELYRKILDITPNDKGAHFALGAIAWQKIHPQIGNQASLAGARAQLDESIRLLSRALEIDGAYFGAMEYLAAALRDRAVVSQSHEEAIQDTRHADALVAKEHQIQEAVRRQWQAAHPQAAAENSCPPATMCFDPEPGSADIPIRWPPEPFVMLPPPLPPPPPPPPPAVRN